MTNAIKQNHVRLLTVAVAAMAVFGAFAVSQAQAAQRHFDGTVLSTRRVTVERLVLPALSVVVARMS